MLKTSTRVRKLSPSIALKKVPTFAIERITAIIEKTYKAEAEDCEDCRANQAKEQSQALQVIEIQQHQEKQIEFIQKHLAEL